MPSSPTNTVLNNPALLPLKVLGESALAEIMDVNMSCSHEVVSRCGFSQVAHHTVSPGELRLTLRFTGEDAAKIIGAIMTHAQSIPEEQGAALARKFDLAL